MLSMIIYVGNVYFTTRQAQSCNGCAVIYFIISIDMKEFYTIVFDVYVIKN